MDYNLLEETNQYHSVFKVMEKDNKYMLIDDLEIHYVELPKFADTKNVDEMNELEQWTTFIKDTGVEGKDEIIGKIKERSGKIKMAVEMLEKISADEKMRQQYLAREKARLDEKSKIYYAEKKVKLEVAKNALLKDASIEFVSEVTGLSAEEIEKLRDNIKK